MENQTPVRKSGANAQLVVILILAVLLVIFTLQNQEKVTLKVFFWTIREIPIALLLVITMLLGYLIPYFLLIPRIWRLKSELTKTRKEKQELEESREQPVRSRVVRDPEGIPFDDEGEEEEVDLARKNLTSRLFKE